jgi:membrane protein
MMIKGYRPGPLLKRTAGEVMDDNILGLGAQMAYYFFFSLFPIALFLTPLLGLVGDRRENFNFLVTRLADAVPSEAFALMRGVLEQVVFAENAPGIVSIGAVLALWSGSNVFNALIDALNTAYDVEKDERPWWKKRLIAIASLLGVGALFVTATVIVVAGGDIVDAIGTRLGISEAGRLAWTVVQYALALGLLVATAFIVYYFLPCVPQRKSHVLVGAVVATVLWLLVTLGLPLLRAELRELQRHLRHHRRRDRAAHVDVPVDGGAAHRRRARLGAAQGHRRGAHARRPAVRRAHLERRAHRPPERGARRARRAGARRPPVGRAAPRARRAWSRARRDAAPSAAARRLSRAARPARPRRRGGRQLGSRRRTCVPRARARRTAAFPSRTAISSSPLEPGSTSASPGAASA